MPHPPSSSAASRSRRPSERGSRPSSLSGRSLKSAQSSSRRSPRPPAATLARSASPAAQSLYSQKNITSDELASLPVPSTNSPTASLTQLPGTYPADSLISLPPEVPDGQIAEPVQPTVEDETSNIEQAPQPPDLPVPVTSDPPPIREDRPQQPAEEFFPPEPEETAHPPLPTRSSWTSPRSSPTASRAQPYHPQSPPASYVQYPFVHSQPVPPHFQAYHYPGPYYVPQAHPPQYYPPLPPSTVASSPQITHSRVSFSPDTQPQPVSPVITSAGAVPIGMAPTSVDGLERQSSVGSRPSTSADVAQPGSPHGSVASAGRGPAVDPGGGRGGAGPTDETGKLLHRIESTMSNMANISASLPDLHQLLSRYRETHGQLGVREEIIRKTEAQQAETLRQKEKHIDALGKQLDAVGKQLEIRDEKYSAESSKLRLQIGNLEEKQKELLDRNKELSGTLPILVEENVKRESERKKLEKDIQGLRQDYLQEKGSMMRDFEARRKTAQDEFEAEKIAMKEAFEERMKQAENDHAEKLKQVENEHEAKMKEAENEREAIVTQTRDEHEARLKQLEEEHELKLKQVQEGHESGLKQAGDDHETKLKQVENDYEQKLADLASKSAQEKQTMSSEFAKEKAELESNLAAKQQELEQTMAKEREQWQKEREELLKGWQEEREALVKDSSVKSKALVEEHTKNEDSLQGKLKKLESDLKAARSESNAATKTKDDLKQGWDLERAKLERGIAELRGVAENLDKEKSRLQKMVEAFGEVTDMKSKGDTYYIDAFRGLHKQIVDLSKELFAHLPAAPSDEVLARIPPDVPSFLDDTDAARSIRAAYIQHLISKMLCHRIFHPFLFCVSRRHAKADSLFQAMSNDLRNKSTRKEAVWRQHTLYAAYTAPTAKKMTNSAAGAVVEEIARQIRPFADAEKLELVYAGVRRIVKTAAETWRYARLEREMITARMPPSGDTNYKGDEWHCDEHSNGDEAEAAASPRKTLLRLLPVISREPMHESLRTEKDKTDNGCLYSPGVTLCSHCPSVKTRLQELQKKSAPKAGTSPDPSTKPPVPPVSPLLPAQNTAETGGTSTPPAVADDDAEESTDYSSDETAGSGDEEEE